MNPGQLFVDPARSPGGLQHGDCGSVRWSYDHRYAPGWNPRRCGALRSRRLDSRSRRVDSQSYSSDSQGYSWSPMVAVLTSTSQLLILDVTVFGLRSRTLDSQSRTFASQSRTFASQSRTFASQSRTFASQSRTFAFQSRTFAFQSRTFAFQSRTFASRSRTFASRSRTFASQSRTFASRSRTFASQSRTFASRSRSFASRSRGNYGSVRWGSRILHRRTSSAQFACAPRFAVVRPPGLGHVAVRLGLLRELLQKHRDFDVRPPCSGDIERERVARDVRRCCVSRHWTVPA